MAVKSDELCDQEYYQLMSLAEATAALGYTQSNRMVEIMTAESNGKLFTVEDSTGLKKYRASR